jgi:hypothetical protein
MGGFGSGRTGGWPTVEGCSSLVISIDCIMASLRRALGKIKRPFPTDGDILQVQWFPLCWTRSGEDEPWAEVELRLELHTDAGTAWFRYDVDHFNRSTGPQHYPVRMITTPCRYGGVRWWWLCPATGRKVAKLYLPNGGVRFLSRGYGAYRLGYGSQRHGRVDRMHARSKSLYKSLGANYQGNYGERWPPKPKGMHWRTYNAICDRLEGEQANLDNDLIRVAAKWMGGLG